MFVLASASDLRQIPRKLASGVSCGWQWESHRAGSLLQVEGMSARSLRAMGSWTWSPGMWDYRERQLLVAEFLLSALLSMHSFC